MLEPRQNFSKYTDCSVLSFYFQHLFLHRSEPYLFPAAKIIDITTFEAQMSTETAGDLAVGNASTPDTPPSVDYKAEEVKEKSEVKSDIVAKQQTSSYLSDSQDSNKTNDKTSDAETDPDSESKTELEDKSKSETKVKTKPKKRLTLQERLQLAAKKGSSAADRKYKKRSVSSKASKQVHSGSPEPSSVSASSTPRSSTSIERNSAQNHDLSIPKEYADLTKAKLLELVTRNEQTIMKLRQEIKSPENAETKDTNTELESLKKKLKQKDDTIEQIMKEGSELSAKEVRLSQSLKKMKVREQDLENELDISEKNGKLFAMKAIKMEESVSALKDQLKAANNDAQLTRRLQSKSDSLEAQNKKLRQELEVLKGENADLDTLKREKGELNDRFTKLKKDFEQFEADKTRETKVLKEIIQKQKAKHLKNKEESEKEIKRLEAKVEEIRIQNESHLSGSKASRGHNNSESLDSPSLSMLQAQYTQAQENWKLLETSYEKKIGDANTELDMYKKRAAENAKKIRALSNDLNSRTEEMNQQIETESSLTSDLAGCRNELAKLNSDFKSLKQRYDILQKDYDTEKTEFEKKLKELSEEKTRLSETLRLRTDSLNNDQGDGNFTPSFYLNDFDSSTSVTALNQQNRTTSLGNIAVGESALTPGLEYSKTFLNSDSSTDVRRRSRGQLLYLTATQQQQQQQQPQLQPPSPLAGISKIRDHAESSNIQIENGSTILERDEYRDGPIAPSESASNVGGSLAPPSVSNIQLVTKLSARVRQLEREKISLRDENENLSKMKEDASNEILKLMKRFEETRDNEDRLSKLQIEIGETNKRYEQALESLGEKTERCTELQDDVADLKDMLKQQTLELVALHDKVDRK